MELSTSPFDFLRLIEALKNTPPGKGWIIRGIGSPESVSDHMYRMAVMIWMVPEVRSTIASHQTSSAHRLLN